MPYRGQDPCPLGELRVPAYLLPLEYWVWFMEKPEKRKPYFAALHGAEIK